jgi:hypothetical protein
LIMKANELEEWEPEAYQICSRLVLVLGSHSLIPKMDYPVFNITYIFRGNKSN